MLPFLRGRSNMLARWLCVFFFFSLLYIKHNISFIKKIIIYHVIITKKNYKILLRLELLLHNKISLTPKIFHFISIITGNLLDSNGSHYPNANSLSAHQQWDFSLYHYRQLHVCPCLLFLVYIILSYLYSFCILHERNQ